MTIARLGLKVKVILYRSRSKINTVVKCYQEQFNFELPSVILACTTNNILIKLTQCDVTIQYYMHVTDLLCSV